MQKWADSIYNYQTFYKTSIGQVFPKSNSTDVHTNRRHSQNLQIAKDWKYTSFNSISKLFQHNNATGYIWAPTLKLSLKDFSNALSTGLDKLTLTSWTCFDMRWKSVCAMQRL